MVLLFTMLPALYVTSKSPLLPFVLVSAFCARGLPQIWDPWPSITECHLKALCMCFRNGGASLHRVIRWGPSVGRPRMSVFFLFAPRTLSRRALGGIFSIQTFTSSPWVQYDVWSLSSMVPGSPELLWLCFFRVSFLSSTRMRLRQSPGFVGSGRRPVFCSLYRLSSNLLQLSPSSLPT